MNADPERILVVDDEPLGRRSVLRQVAVVFPEAVVREACDGFEALAVAAELAPTLVFLDVDMPECSGFDVLSQLPEPRPRIVFVTAFEHFALRAFEANACDYLVKPFTPERFAAAARRAQSELQADRRLRELERSLARAGQGMQRIAIRTGARVELVELDAVSCLVSKGHYTYLYTGGREHLTELTLVHLEERLDPTRFVRVHRSAIVQWSSVARIIEGSEPWIELADGMRVPLSRRNRKQVTERYRAERG
ncbi:MAG: LytTR family transcriptional regulator DNA-binding domain-containing protein [Polyangiaceae bacterium]